MVAAAMIGGAAITAGAGAASSQSAAGTQASAGSTAAGINMLEQIQNINRQQPWVDQGQWANQQIQARIANGSLGGSFTPQDFLNNKDPGYEWQLQQGQQALQNSQAAQSGVLSGAALKGLIGYNQGMASTGYQSAYERWLNSQKNAYGQLHDMTSLGQNAAAQVGNNGVSSANYTGQGIMGAGNASAAGTMGVGNAIGQGVSNGTGYYALNSMLNNNQGSYGGANDGLSNFLNLNNNFGTSAAV